MPSASVNAFNGQNTARRGFIPVGFHFPRDPLQPFRPLPVPFFVDYLRRLPHAAILPPLSAVTQPPNCAKKATMKRELR
jgi:hypothetical protein